MVVQEFVTAIWLEGAYQVFRSQRLTRMDRRKWFKRAGYALNQVLRKQDLTLGDVENSVHIAVRRH